MENDFKCEINRISSTYLNEIKINVQFAFRRLVVVFSCWKVFQGLRCTERQAIPVCRSHCDVLRRVSLFVL